MCRHVSKKCIADDTTAAACRSPNCIRRTKKMFCGTRVSVPLATFYKKTASQHKISLKSGNWLLSYNPKMIFNIAAICRLKYVIKFKMYGCVPYFIKIGRFFVVIWQCDDFQDGGCPPSRILGVQQWVL